MNLSSENIIAHSREYTPVYLIEDPGIIQGASYLIRQNNLTEPKPVSDNLKKFYESIGNIENSLQNNVENSPKPRILKKSASSVVGNNLKLASFLKPNTDLRNKQFIQSTQINNIIVKPSVSNSNITINNLSGNNTNGGNISGNSVSANGINRDHSVPKVHFDRKIVKVPNIPKIIKAACEKPVIKTKPKILQRSECVKEIKPPNPNPSKHTSVQLLKLGETYHSLNQLSEDQMKIVNQALKIFSDPDKIPLEPTYDPVTNTRFIYKVVSPRDLTVVGKNKVVIKDKKAIKRKNGVSTKFERKIIEYETCNDSSFDEDSSNEFQPTITRCGRKVKQPVTKQHIIYASEKSPRIKKKVIPQVASDFCSCVNVGDQSTQFHSDLFECLLAITEDATEDEKATLFIEQLENLIDKLKSILPCILKKIDGQEGKLCNINDDIGRLFGMNPGKYNLNVEALTCVKDKSGHCKHNPPKPIQINPDMPKLIQNEQLANIEAETEVCARINSVDKWPTINKRTWKKQKSPKPQVKKLRLASESVEPLIELGSEDLASIFIKPSEQSAIVTSQYPTVAAKEDIPVPEVANDNCSPFVENSCKKLKGSHIQFHSSHFDIRSSPIKPSAAVFSKFQINPEKMGNYDGQIIRPLDLDKQAKKEIKLNEVPEPQPSIDTCTDFQGIFRNELQCKEDIILSRDLNYDATKSWTLISPSEEQSHDSFMKSTGSIEPALLHITDTLDKSSMANELDQNDHLASDNQLLSAQSQSVLNFLEALGNECLSYPETEIRHNAEDFQLDLFSFTSS